MLSPVDQRRLRVVVAMAGGSRGTAAEMVGVVSKAPRVNGGECMRAGTQRAGTQRVGTQRSRHTSDAGRHSKPQPARGHLTIKPKHQLHTLRDYVASK